MNATLEHNSADADCFALHGGNQRLARLVDGFDEAMDRAVDRAVMASLAREIRQVVTGSEAVAVTLEQNHTNGRRRLRPLECIRQRVISSARQRFLLLPARQ